MNESNIGNVAAIGMESDRSATDNLREIRDAGKELLDAGKQLTENIDELSKRVEHAKRRSAEVITSPWLLSAGAILAGVFLLSRGKPRAAYS